MRRLWLVLLLPASLLIGSASVAGQQAPQTPNSRQAEQRAERGGQHAAARTESRARLAARASLDVGKINDPNTMDMVGPRSQGDAVVRAAILLDRIKFSPGEIGRTYNDNLAKAVKAFQSANGLNASGTVDAMTWQKLNGEQAGEGNQATSGAQQQGQNQQGQQQQGQSQQGQNQQQQQSQNQQGQNQAPARSAAEPLAITKYVIALEDVSGPFTKLPTVTGRNAGEALMLREARLKQLNYESAAQLLGERFHCSTALLRELNPGKVFEKAGTQINVPNVNTPDPPKAASVLVDGSAKAVEALDANGKILGFYPATVGSEHDPLPAGDWKFTEITHYPHFKYNPNLFWDSENKNPRATLAPGPKNPVGVVWMGISKPHYGIHGTPNPATIGKTESHGCIRLTNWDALELSKIVSVGMPVMIKAGQ